MFTIIICRQEIIDDCKKKYNSFLEPLTDQNYGFACWDTEADNLDDAVPALRDYMKLHKEWRAVIVCDSQTIGLDGVRKENPFDVCGYVPASGNLSSVESIKEFRKAKEESFEKAIQNPLVKISNWLMGANIIDYEDPKDSIEGLDDEINDEYFRRVEESAVGLYPDEKILAYELNRERIKRDNLLLNVFGEEPVMDCVPKQIILLCERAVVRKNYLHNYAEEHIETEYSQFYEDNLYPAKARYILYDINYVNGSRDADDYFGFLTFLNIFAAHEYPNDAIKPERVYTAKAVLLQDELKKSCDDYLSKLKSSERHIQQEIYKLNTKKNSKVDNSIVDEVFGEDIDIPVVISADHSPDMLYCDYRGIGLATDVPSSEKASWEEQYNDIEKEFVRYLREPRRAVKTAVKSSFRANNNLEDERALVMDEFQQENVQLELFEREDSMVDVQLGNLFKTSKYKEEIEEANREVRKRIGQRMTLKNIIISSVIAAVLFLMCSVPFVIDAYRQSDGEELSWAFFGVGIVCFAIVGMIMLFVFRRQMINRLMHFNYVMSGIVDDIKRGLDRFSDYISYACNVMRRFSVLNYVKTDADKTKKIMLKHQNDISGVIKEVYKRYPRYASDEIKIDDEGNIYNYDFRQRAAYQYDMPIAGETTEIEYLQNGNMIMVPVKYVDRIELTREELYD